MTTLKDSLQLGRAINMHNRARGIKPADVMQKQIDMLNSQVTLVVAQRDDMQRRLEDAHNYIAKMGEVADQEAEIERLRDLIEKLPAELRCIAMDYGVAGNIDAVDASNYCADHIDAVAIDEALAALRKEL